MLRVTLRDLQFRRRQFAIAVVGATLVLAMALVLTGISGGFRAEARATVDDVGADVWITRQGSVGPFSSTSALGGEVVGRVAATPGITAAAPLVLLRESLHDGDRAVRVNVFGHEPGGLGTPRVRAGRAATQPGEAVVDGRTGVEIGDTFVLSGQQFSTVGRTTGLTAFAGVPNVYVSVGDARALAYGGRELETVVVAKGSPTALPEDLVAMTPAQARADLLSYLDKGVKAIDNVRVFLWVVSAVVIGVVMYLSTLERLRDFAVLKAMGWTSGALFGGLVIQGVLVALLAALLASVIANLLVPLIPLRSVIPRAAFAILPAVAIGIGLLASLAGLRRAVAVDPALAFAGR